MGAQKRAGPIHQSLARAGLARGEHCVFLLKFKSEGLGQSTGRARIHQPWMGDRALSSAHLKLHKV